MDRSDRPLCAAADPPTVKTEPPGPSPEGAREPGQAASQPAEPGVTSNVESEDAQPDSSSAPATASSDPEQSDAPSRVASGEAEAAARSHPEPAVAEAQTAGNEIDPAASAGMNAAGGDAPSVGNTAPLQFSSWVRGHPRPLLADWDRERVKSVSVRAAKVAAIVFSAWFTVVLILIAAYRFINPPFSTLMAMRWLGGTSIHRQWVPIEKISPHLVRTVIASEDGRFCHHWGIDFGELAEAIKRTSHGTPRGASTITMQVAKNLFLWPAKSYVRKVIEVPLTYAIELMWPKWRIMEVYLNIAEWGPGTFGAEAAARDYFDRPARGLTWRQAAQLAVALPNPLRWDAGDPGPWARRRATIIHRRAVRSPEAARCVLGSD